MIHCEILAPNHRSGDDLGRIARSCAIDLKLSLPIAIDKRIVSKRSETSITLEIPMEIALLYEAVWQLASRIACFCPQVRVSAEIQSIQKKRPAHQ